jgi:hypothetical protein
LLRLKLEPDHIVGHSCIVYIQAISDTRCSQSCD